jgi:Right handed beta helix region
MTKFTVAPQFVLANKRFPNEALKPRSYGHDSVEFLEGDYTSVMFSPMETARYYATGNVSVSLVMQSLKDAEFIGFHIPGQLQIRSCQDCIVCECTFTGKTAAPIRIRFGSHRNTIYRCLLQRAGNIPVHDVVGIYMSDGPNYDNVITHNTVLNYTDAVQLGRGASDAEITHAAGTWIKGNVFGITEEFRNGNGTMRQGLEQAGWDLKIGGAEDNPVIIEKNLVFGGRPVVLAGAGSPGYACTYHLRVDNVLCMANTYVDCESVHFLNILYDDNRVVRKANLKFSDETYIDIRNNGFNSPWPDKQGKVFVGPGSAIVSKPVLVRCAEPWKLAPLVVDQDMIDSGSQ